jgi:predicted dienelactone hydrolase
LGSESQTLDPKEVFFDFGSPAGLKCSLWYDLAVLRSEDIDLFDGTRERRVPVRLWLPSTAVRAWALFSVGFGGDRSGYAYLGRAWAGRGIATAVVEHIGSNLDVLKGLPGRTRAERHQEVVRRVADPEELSNRPRDLHFAHANLAGRFIGLPLGLAGHSYGTYTVLAAMGLPTVPRLREPLPAPLSEVSSCLVISPQAPGLLFSGRALSTLKAPTLVLTGTKDAPLSGEGDFRQRVAVFDHLPTGFRNLVVLEGVEHMAFAGIGLNLAATLRTVEGLTGQWWESTLWDAVPPPDRRASDLSQAAGESLRGDYR